MAQQDTENTAPRFGTQAVAKYNERHNVTNFLLHKDLSGFEWHDAPLGIEDLRHKVVVHEKDTDAHMPGHPVTLRISASGIHLQEYLTTDEARLLAQALTLAADHADRAAAIAPSAEVAA